MKRIGITLTLLMFIIVMSSCSKTEEDTCTNCFNPIDYEISASIEINTTFHSHLNVTIDIDDNDEVLEDAFLTVTNSKGQIVYMVKEEHGLSIGGLTRDIEINYLIQNEEYLLEVRGYIETDGDLLSATLIDTTYKTGLWEVEKSEGNIQSFDVTKDSIEFNASAYFYDYFGKCIQFEISKTGEDEVHETQYIWLRNDNYSAVNRHQSVYAQEFVGLLPNTEYTITMKLLTNYYDYDNETKEYVILTVDEETITTNPY